MTIANQNIEEIVNSEEWELIKFCAELNFEDLSEKVVHHAKMIILDSIGAIVGGFYFNKLYRDWSTVEGRKVKGASTVLGSKLRTESSLAAMFNGTAGTSLELDEGNRFCAGHPAMHVIPSALAISESYECSGKDFIAAFVAGYELAARVGMAISPMKSRYHPHGTWGVVGSAMAAAKLLKLDNTQTANAVTIASNYSLNTLFDTALEGASVRDTYCGLSNLLGIQAARMAGSGFTGLPGGVERHFKELCKVAINTLFLDKPKCNDFLLVNNYFKLYAACRYVHGVIDALKYLIKNNDINLDSIKRIKVYTYNIASKLKNVEPKNALQAKFSIPYSVAVRLLYDRNTPEVYTDKFISKKIINIAKKVEVYEDISYSMKLPEKRPSRIEIETKDKDILASEVELPEGDSPIQYTDKQLLDKFVMLMSSNYSLKNTENIIKKIIELPKLKTINDLTEDFLL